MIFFFFISVALFYSLFFFFSSRRRHTRFKCDWSSDVCSSDLLDLVKKVARDELESETWLRSVARLSGRSYEALRVSILEFMDADAFNVSVENCESFLDP